MTVAELCAWLQQQPQDAEVWIQEEHDDGPLATGYMAELNNGQRVFMLSL